MEVEHAAKGARPGVLEESSHDFTSDPKAEMEVHTRGNVSPGSDEEPNMERED